MYNRDFDQQMPQWRDFNIDISKGMDERFGYASVMHERLLEEIALFEEQLEPDEEIAAYLASFGREMYLEIESIGYRDPYHLILSGITSDGRKARLVQHVSQTSILFVSMQVKPEENREPRRFGFRLPEDDG